MMRRRAHSARGFTLVEVMLAAALLGIVGSGILTFLGAFASGSSARARVSDPALEATLAVRRLEAIAAEERPRSPGSTANRRP
jgi:prepilin-type N-terminal cleavage/methylation domain-containing protein